MRPQPADVDADAFDDGFEPFDDYVDADAFDEFSDPDYLAPVTIVVRDPYGVVRKLTDFGGADLEGTHDIGQGIERYWIPRAVAATWERVA